MEHEVSQTLVHSHSLCIAPDQGKFNFISITSKPRKVVMEKKSAASYKYESTLHMIEVHCRVRNHFLT